MEQEINVISIGTDVEETVVIKTAGCGEHHEFYIQTDNGEFDPESGCMEWMDGELFDRDELSEIELAHFKIANKAFNER
jgi:hypothetical protein